MTIVKETHLQWMLVLFIISIRNANMALGYWAARDLHRHPSNPVFSWQIIRQITKTHSERIYNKTNKILTIYTKIVFYLP